MAARERSGGREPRALSAESTDKHALSHGAAFRDIDTDERRTSGAHEALSPPFSKQRPAILTSGTGRGRGYHLGWC